MDCEVEFTDEFFDWFEGLSEAEQDSVDVHVGLLEAKGATLGYPHSSGVSGSRHSHMRELRVQHQGRPLRVLYAFDPRRNAILLLGGDKTGNKRWYEEQVPIAEKIYDKYLEALKREGFF